MQRRNVLVALGAAFVAGCSKISDSKWFGALVDGAEGWHRGIHRTLGAGRIALAPEYALDRPRSTALNTRPRWPPVFPSGGWR